MKALILTGYGGPDCMTLADRPDTEPGPGEIAVAIHAASINPIDWKMREGEIAKFFKIDFPKVLGRDFSGEVSAVGDGVADLAVGDAVFGFPTPATDGTHAERAVMAADRVALKPLGAVHEAAAALGVAGASALAALETTAPVKAGHRVLIHAAAGGVGHLAVQYAKHKGAEVIGTCGPGNIEFVEELGADQVIDYTAGPISDRVRDVDIVLDSVGGAVHAASKALLKPGGTLVYLNAGPIPEDPKRGDITVVNAPVPGGRAAMERVAALFEAGVLIPYVESAFPFEAIEEAYALSQSGHARGKIVVTMR
jgi:NADPH:quinone reductase-like Zn-dependent oxidoreductase